MEKNLQRDRLAILRCRVDAIDRRIVRLLGLRQRMVAAMKPLKSRLRDPAREAEILRFASRQGRRTGADPAFVRKVYEALLAASRSFLRRQA